MVLTLIRRLVAVFAVLFGLVSFAGSAGAQGLSPMDPGIQVQENRVQEKKVGTKVQHRRAQVRRHLRAKRYAYARSHARRAHHHRVHARAHRAAPAVASAPSAAPTLRSGAVVARVDLAAQRMTVTVGNDVVAVWHVSTARKGFVTPRGSYGPKRMHVSYFSKKYYNSPMPYSIFFTGGYAVHGTGAIKALGRPASHGCVRLATGNARTLFNLIRANGVGRARIIIS